VVYSCGAIIHHNSNFAFMPYPTIPRLMGGYARIVDALKEVNSGKKRVEFFKPFTTDIQTYFRVKK
jgi:hypothetical protein